MDDNGLPKLNGSERQVSWAIQLRNDFIRICPRDYLKYARTQQSAAWWIENRYRLVDAFAEQNRKIVAREKEAIEYKDAVNRCGGEMEYFRERLARHAEKYPTFDADRLYEFVAKKDAKYQRWAFHQPITRINKGRKFEEGCAKLGESKTAFRWKTEPS